MITGYKRSLTIKLSRKIYNLIDTSFQLTYDGKNAFTWNSNVYNIISESDLAEMTIANYLQRLNDFKQYVVNDLNVNHSISVNIDSITDSNYESYEYDPDLCIETTSTTTSTSTSTTTSTSTSTSTSTTTEPPLNCDFTAEFTEVISTTTSTSTSTTTEEPFTPTSMEIELISPNPAIKYNGRAIFVSKDGINLYIHIDTSSDSSGVSRVFRYVMSTPHNLNTATYNSQYTFNVSLPSGYARKEIYFSENGTTLLVGVKTPNSLSTLADQKIETYVLSTPWDITSIQNRYITDYLLNLSNEHRSQAFSFNDDLGIMYVHRRATGGLFSRYYPINLNNIKNETNITPLPSNNVTISYDYSNNHIGNRISNVPFKYFFSIENTSGHYGVYSHNLEEFDTDNIYPGGEKTMILERNVNYFAYHTDFHYIYSTGYIYVLEDNRGLSQLLFPRIAFYV